MPGAVDARTPLAQASEANYGGAVLRETDNTNGPDQEAEEETSRFFPIEPFRCFPAVLVAFIPGTWRKIVSVPHLVLLIGTTMCIFLVAETLHGWIYTRSCRSKFCELRIGPIVFVALCIFHFIRTIQQYDEVLQQKQKELQAAKRDLDRQYKETVSELEGCLAKSLGSQVVLAEGGFEEKRRDFSRWLKKYELVLRGNVPDSGTPVTAMREDFLKFVSLWLAVFAECSIDPVNHPLKVVDPEELEQCSDLVEVVTLLSERLRNVAVKFVSSQREKDKTELKGISQVRSAMKKTHKSALKLKEAICGHVPALEAGASFQSGAVLPDAEAGGAVGEAGEGERDEYRWVQWGRSEKLGVQRDDVTNGFPVEHRMGCVTVILLSAEHVRLILGFILGWVLIILELTHPMAKRKARLAELNVNCRELGGIHCSEILRDIDEIEVKYPAVIEVFVCIFCITFVLHQFLDIDIVQQLDMQLQELEQAQKEVLVKRERILNFYEASQELSDVWVHRTLPRLMLIKHLYDNLGDCPIQEHGELWKAINERLVSLEDVTSPLSDWRGSNVLSEQKKKAFGNTIADAVNQNLGIKETLSLLPECERRIRVEFGLPALETDAVAAAAPLEDGEMEKQEKRMKKAPGSLEAGDAVEYYSQSRGRWIPAIIRTIDPRTGLMDLDCKDQVEPSSVRPVGAADEQSGCRQQ